jgi:hypothetical protein
MKFFAERLVRLGIVNIQIELEGISEDESTRISMRKGDVNVVLLRRTKKHVIPLDSAVRETKELIFPGSQSIINCRIPVVPCNTVREPQPLISADDFQGSNYAGELWCLSCRREILVGGKLRWRDLPSDSWIEFSDYWHCHSGRHSHNHDEHILPSPVNEVSVPIIKATPGTGLIGTTFLLIHPVDTRGIIIEVISAVFGT